jgi:hypothetical protein
VHIPEIVQVVTKYLAQRLVERERALAGIGTPLVGDLRREAKFERRKRRRHAIQIFLLGLFAGVGALIATALLLGPRP